MDANLEAAVKSFIMFCLFAFVYTTLVRPFMPTGIQNGIGIGN